MVPSYGSSDSAARLISRFGVGTFASKDWKRMPKKSSAKNASQVEGIVGDDSNHETEKGDYSSHG